MSKIRVLVIDDSAFNRRTITKILEAIPEVEVIGYAVDGEEGMRRILALKPDLVTLDLEMPRMDGFTLLRIIMSNCPTPVIVVSSQGGDESVFKALELGAVDFILKPTAGAFEELIKIREDLHEKVREVFNLNMSCVKKRGELLRKSSEADSVRPVRKIAPLTVPRKRGQEIISVVAIGASTGGPPALQSMFSAFPGGIPFSIVVSQHMPSGFTRTFAERLNRTSALEVVEACEGDQVRPGCALIAPGGKNMVFRKADGCVTVQLLDPEPGENYLPSVDRMFQSGSEVFGSKFLGVVLTGMGNDGSLGVRAIKEAGGQVLSESEDSAVIFGMPRAAIATGVVDSIVPLEKMTDEILVRCGFSGERN
ncbi:MAG: chemotaxis response regulator protein-glutamate methylesterase [Deltaproteobacteria bacterium]|nr:chemotaxis response regulator protein-glutamate methylesterase [Deltaproteobacteria bacterium]TLN05173.1 MAG: chemotaxis response regulator protein-glutamate methylesterase [bacterium]